MDQLLTFLYSPKGAIVLSILWGIALAILVRPVQEIEYQSPDGVDDKVFYFNTLKNPECYQYQSYAVKCPE